MYNEMGELRGFSAISRDISERKQQEEVLREREQALELAPVLIRDMQDRIVTWNQSCENLYGFSKAEALGSVSHKLLRTEFPEPLPAIMERFRRDGAWIGELVHYRRDGSPVVVNSQWGLFSDEQGRPVRIVETNADISERKLVEHQIQELNAELEKRVGERTADLQATNKELEAFTYSVSHDLRAPLRHIAGFSKMLAEEYSGSLAPEARHYLKRIQDGIHRMGTLVDDLLSLTRIGRHELRVQVTGVESIVKDVIAELAPDVEKREVSWEISNLPYVEADPALLRVVFQNLLANAVKYTRPRQKATIEVGQTQIDGERVLFVRDNGVGFNMKYADKLFGVFQRLHRAEDFEGTGVGLATVQRVVQKHGGRIWADAELDKGATFYFTLKNTAAKPAVHDAAKAGGGL
jgi:PAS domain S-box-containing protein